MEKLGPTHINLFTSLSRNKSRRSTTRHRGSTFACSPLEHLHSNNVFEGIFLFTRASDFLVQYSLSLHQINNSRLSRNTLNRSMLASFVTNAFIRLESLAEGIHVDCGSFCLFGMSIGNLHVSKFQTDEHSEN